MIKKQKINKQSRKRVQVANKREAVLRIKAKKRMNNRKKNKGRESKINY